MGWLHTSITQFFYEEALEVCIQRIYYYDYDYDYHFIISYEDIKLI